MDYANPMVKDAGRMLLAASHVRATRGTSQTVLNNSQTTIVFSTEVDDSLSEFDPSTGVFTAAIAGFYAVAAAATLTGSAPSYGGGDVMALRLLKNGATVLAVTRASQSHDDWTLTLSAGGLNLAVGDTLEVQANQTNAGVSSRTTTADATGNFFTIDRLA